MKHSWKWLSIVAVSVAMIIILYYAGVVNSSVSAGIAVAVIIGFLLLGRLLIPPPKK